MTYYSKVIAAVVGLAVLILARYGIELSGSEAVITDALVAIATAFSVYFVRNTPTNEDQRAQALQNAQEATKE